MSTGMKPVKDERNETVRVRQNAGGKAMGGAVMTISQNLIPNTTDAGKSSWSTNSIVMTRDQVREMRDRMNQWLDGSWEPHFEDLN